MLGCLNQASLLKRGVAWEQAEKVPLNLNRVMPAQGVCSFLFFFSIGEEASAVADLLSLGPRFPHSLILTS